MGSRLRIAALAVVACLTSWPLPAHAQADGDGEAKPMNPKAHELLVLGLSHFEAKEYEAAIREFRAGYAIDPRPELLFAIAQAERLSGDCRSAIKAYQMFLKTSPPERQAAAATDAVDRCRTALGITGDDPEPKSDPAPTPTPTPAHAPGPAHTPALTHTPAPTRTIDSDSLATPWYRDKLGASLLAAGVVSASVGVGYYVASSSDESAAGEAATYGEYVDLMDRAERRRTVAWVGLGLGAGLVTGAVVHYWMRDDAPDRGVALNVTGDGATFVYATNF